MRTSPFCKCVIMGDWICTGIRLSLNPWYEDR